MKFDPTKVLTDLDGAELKDGDKPLTASTICQRALLSAEQQQISGEENMRRFRLASRLHDATGQMDLTAEEAALIKARVAAHFAPLVVGRVFDMIEG